MSTTISSSRTKCGPVCSHLNFGNLDVRATDYIRDIVKIAEKRFGSTAIDGVIVFGSVVHKQTSKISDVDLLLIVEDRISTREIKKLAGIFHSVEIKHNFSHPTHNIFEMILHMVEMTTGMFRSFFVARHSDWMKGNFASIFGTNPIVTKLLAPDKIVLNSVISGARLLYGSPELLKTHFGIEPGQMIKSLMMDSAIAIGTLAILPLDRNNMKYSLEALKWAFRATFVYLFGKTDRFSIVQKSFATLGISDSIIGKLNSLRKSLRPDWFYAIQIPYQILKIHILGFSHHKRFFEI